MILKKPTFSRILLYIFFATTILSIISYNIISWEFNKHLNLGVEIIELIISFIVIIQLLLIQRRYQQSTSLTLIFVQAFACFALGELFWILHLYIKEFEPLGSFSISDLSWVGFFAFIITAYRDIFNKQPVQKLKNNIVTILCTVAVLVTIVTGFVVLYVSGDELIYTIIYLAPSLILGFYSIKQIFVTKNFKLLHINILAIIYSDIFASIAANFNFEFEYDIRLVFALVILCIIPTILFGIQKELQADKKEAPTKQPEMAEV